MSQFGGFTLIGLKKVMVEGVWQGPKVGLIVANAQD